MEMSAMSSSLVRSSHLSAFSLHASMMSLTDDTNVFTCASMGVFVLIVLVSARIIEMADGLAHAPDILQRNPSVEGA